MTTSGAMTPRPAAGSAAGGDPAAGLRARAVVERGTFRLDVAFAVAPGEVVGVLGPNGAGKSTLLRALAGLVPLSAGSITLDGAVVDDGARAFTPPSARPVGLVFQDYRLFPHLSVRDNVAFAPRSRGARRRAARSTADGWLDRLGVLDLADRKPAALSGGQAQRVALARALAADPSLLLLDEPLAALDARTRLDTRAELRRHLAAFAGPTLIVTHDPLEAMVMADRLLVVEGGRIAQQGAPADVARRPLTEYVARLVGLNLYAGTATGSPATVRLTDGGTFVGAGHPDGVPAATGEVLVAVRPSAIAVHADRPLHGSPRNVWPGVVVGMEPLADRVRLEVGGAPPALVDLTAAAVADLRLHAGAPVWLSVKATDVDVYPDPRPGGR